MTSNFYSVIHKNLLENPDKTFIKWPNPGGDDLYFTGHDLLEGVAFVCKSLQLKKIKPGDRILLGIPFSFELVCALLGIMAYGGTAVIPPTNTKEFALFRLLLKHKIRGVYMKEPEDHIKKLLSIFGIKTMAQDAALQQINYFKPVQVPQEQDALISFSSGTTGKPSAVHRTHKILRSQHLALKESFPPLPQQQDFPLFPNVLLHNLCLGITTVIPDIPDFDVRETDPEKIIAQLLDEGIDSLTGNVHYFRILVTHLQKEKIILPDVKKIGIGGSPVPEYLPHLLQNYFVNAEIFIIYGSTQAEPISVRKVTEDRRNPARGYFVGIVHRGIELRIQSPTTGKESTPHFEPGLVEVNGDHVVTTPGNDWLNTGDYGYLNEKDELFLTARAGNDGALEGFTHYQLEHVLAHVPGVNHAAAIFDPNGFRIYVEGKTPVADLRTSLAKHFPAGIISSIEFIEKMPLDARHHSKILYKDLCKPNLKK
ncbi:MAG: AMP-binding protein [Gillisia sp.]